MWGKCEGGGALAALVSCARFKNPRKIAERGTRILPRHNGSRCFGWRLKERRLEYFKDQRGIAYEGELNGKFVLLSRTKSNWLSASQVVEVYKDLREIERAFPELSSFIQLRPIQHYKNARVRGHVRVRV